MIRNKRAAAYWLCQIAGWTIVFLFDTMWIAIFMPEALRRVMVAYACASALAILCTHVYRSVIRRRGWTKLSPLRALPRVALASGVTGVILGYIAVGLWMLMVRGPYHTGGSLLWWPLTISIFWVVYVFLWSVIYFEFHRVESYRQTEMEKLRLQVTAKEAQLQGLVAQINPHFVFNCLNSLRGLIPEDPVRAQSMVTELSSLLRYSLQTGKSVTAPLETEMEIVRSYLRLESIRFEERLSVDIGIQPETLNVPVPRMLLQMLVENGVKHGIEKRPEGGRIQIQSRLEDGALKVKIINSGQLSPNAAPARVGLANAQERLRLLYGGAATLKLENLTPESVAAHIKVPVTS